MADNILYCICKQYYDASRFMIECDICNDWFHGSCVGIREDQSLDIEEFHCPSCSIANGPLRLKKRVNEHRHDYTEDYDPNSAVQAGTMVFVRNLKTKYFPDIAEILLEPSGHELNERYLETKGFKAPILVEDKEGLGLLVPPPTFTVSDVEQYVGSMTEIDAIDVSRQEEWKMMMSEWVDYYNSPNRDKVLNVISLEFSNTKLSELVEVPALVRRVSWVENMWPEYLPDDAVYAKPQVSKYCLMGVKNSYTDFHVDFGGTSVWYHVLRGEKIFYLIRPTDYNLRLYEEWSESDKQNEVFLGSKVDACYKCVVKQGQTLFIPTGWIHAVLTSVDSLVFGGNFLHSYNIGLQIQIYEMERRLKTPQRFQFPWFETTLWFAGKHIIESIKYYSQNSVRPPSYLLDGAKAMAQIFRTWTGRKELRHHIPEIPLSVNYSKLIKDLSREAKVQEQLKPQIKKKKGKKKSSTEESVPEPEFTSALVKELSNVSKQSTHHLPAQVVSPTVRNQQYFAQAQRKQALKVRLPKAGQATSDSTTPYDSADDKSSLLGSPAARGLKIVLSNGKIVSQSGSPVTTRGGGFLSLTSSDGMKEDQEEVNVDDVAGNVKGKTAAQLLAGSSQGPLKLKLSFNGKSSLQSPTSSNKKSSQDSSQLDTSAFDSDDDDVMPSDRSPRSPPLSSVDALLRASEMDSSAPLQHISVADIEAELKQQPASPGTQDAIQGMLSISLPQRNVGALSGVELDGSSPEGSRWRRPRKRRYLDDLEDDEMRNCFQDAKYVYPSLDDDENDLPLKSRGKIPRRDPGDIPWNPKAKVVMPVPKMNRPHRKGVRKAHVEEGLADAAARLANKPKQKRQYIRRKRLPPKKTALEDYPSTSVLTQSLGPYDIRSEFTALGGLSNSAPSSVLAAMKQEGPGRPRKPKKGMATAKQRLSKILKLQRGGRMGR